MDLTSLAIAALALSSGIVGWDILSRRRATEPPTEAHRNVAELAYYILLIAGFGLLVMLKIMTFAGVLFTATVMTGIVWAWDVVRGARMRAKDKAEPIFVEISRGFFPIILVVFLLRSFLVEPFKIPSGSMIPSLLVGDFILVNKYTYGVRLPVLNKKIVEVNQPQKGDVMVFRYPEDTSIDYIKRVVGTPGDRVEYRNKRLTINGTPASMTLVGSTTVREKGLSAQLHELYTENLGDHTHSVILNPERSSSLELTQVRQFPGKENCSYNEEGFACTVPAGHYFMMGDNRDGSADSRYWGFVPEQNIVGRAFLIWWNFSDFKRIGNKII
jgi:signal peptidase I